MPISPYGGLLLGIETMDRHSESQTRIKELLERMAEEKALRDEQQAQEKEQRMLRAKMWEATAAEMTAPPQPQMGGGPQGAPAMPPGQGSMPAGPPQGVPPQGAPPPMMQTQGATPPMPMPGWKSLSSIAPTPPTGGAPSPRVEADESRFQPVMPVTWNPKQAYDRISKEQGLSDDQKEMLFEKMQAQAIQRNKEWHDQMVDAREAWKVATEYLKAKNEGRKLEGEGPIKGDFFNALRARYGDDWQKNPQAQKELDAYIKRKDSPTRISLGGGEGKAPSGYRWSKSSPGNLEAIPGGPADPEVVASKKNAIQLTGGRESVYTTRVMQAANQASKDLANIVKVPVMTTGPFGGRHQGPGLFDATKEILAQEMTPQEAQTYNVMATGLQRSLAAVETSGLAQGIQEFSKQIDVVAKAGDTELTKLHKLAQVRQIIEAGLEPVLANPRVSEGEKSLARKAIENVHEAVPFTHSDLIELTAKQEANSNTTLRQILPKFQKKGGDDDDVRKKADAILEGK